MDWEIDYKGERRSLAAWGLEGLRRTRCSQGEDVVVLREAHRLLEEPFLFEPEGVLRVFREGEPWFEGLVTRVPAWGDAQQEAREYAIAGPWWYLQNTVYQQAWKNRGSETQVESGHVVLGLDSEGEPITTGAQVRAILDYARACGAPFEVGRVFEGFHFPLLEVKDLTCAEALRRVLRWHPDAVTHFDYRRAKPLLHIEQRTQIKKKTLFLKKTPGLESVSLTPQQGGKVSEVVICYEETQDTAEGLERTIERDVFPAGATGKTPKALVMTVPLQPPHVTYLKAAIVVKRVEPESVEWWQEHLPFLKDLSVRDITVDAVEIPDVLTLLKNELIEGAIADWMPVEAKRIWLCAQLSWETTMERVVSRDVRIELTITNAQTQEYHTTLVHAMDEPAEAGLAKKLYESLNFSAYSGQLRLIAPDLPTRWHPGKRLRLQGGPQPGIEVLVQSVTEDLSSGRVTLALGSPKHLGPQDLITLLQLNRQREVPGELVWRAYKLLTQDSQLRDPKALAQARFTREQNIQMGLGSYSKVIMYDEKNYPKCLIRMDLSDIPDRSDGQEIIMRFRRMFYYDGKRCYESYALMSQDFPYDDPEEEPEG